MIKKNGQSVTFKFDQPSESPVFLVGDFNDWNPTSSKMRKTRNNSWSLKVDLKPGEHQYRYYCDGRWYNDHRADKYLPNNIDGDNSVVVVPGIRAAKKTSVPSRGQKAAPKPAASSRGRKTPAKRTSKK